MKYQCCLDPTIEHYTCIVDLLGRFGLIDEAMSFLRQMGAGLYKSGGLGTEQVSLVSASADNIGASSGSSGSLIEKTNGGSGSFFGQLGPILQEKGPCRYFWTVLSW